MNKQPPEVFCKKGVRKNFAKFTGKHLSRSLFFNKELQARGVQLYLKMTLQRMCFPLNFPKFSRPPSLQNTFGRLPLHN